jgi:hypothetical protein
MRALGSLAWKTPARKYVCAKPTTIAAVRRTVIAAKKGRS